MLERESDSTVVMGIDCSRDVTKLELPAPLAHDDNNDDGIFILSLNFFFNMRKYLPSIYFLLSLYPW